MVNLVIVCLTHYLKAYGFCPTCPSARPPDDFPTCPDLSGPYTFEKIGGNYTKAYEYRLLIRASRSFTPDKHLSYSHFRTFILDTRCQIPFPAFAAASNDGQNVLGPPISDDVTI